MDNNDLQMSPIERLRLKKLVRNNNGGSGISNLNSFTTDNLKEGSNNLYTTSEEKTTINNAILSLDNIGKKSISRYYNTVAKMYTGLTTKIICFGDSITWGQQPTIGGQTANPYPSVLQTKLRKIYNNSSITVTNAGNSGYTSGQLLTVVDTQVVANNPDLVILMCGINDANPANNVTRDTYKSNMISLVKTIINSGSELLLLSSTPIKQSNSDRLHNLLTYTRITEDIAKQFEIGFIDLNKEFEKLFLFKRDIPYITYGSSNMDYIHLSDVGYSYLAEIVAGKGLNYNGLENIVPVINNETHVIVVNNSSVATDCTGISSTTSQYAQQSYYLASDSSTGTYLRFAFFADRDGMDLYLVGAKTRAGGQISILDNGTAIQTYDAFTAMTATTAKYDAEDLMIENLSYGLHIIEFLVSNIVVGQSSTGVGKIYLSEFVFKPTMKQSTDVSYKFTGSNYPYMERFSTVSKTSGLLRLVGTGVTQGGALMQDDKTATLKNGKTLVIEAQGMFVTDSGISWFGSKVDNSLGTASFGYLVNLTASSIDLYVYNDGAKVSLGTFAITNTFNNTHKIRVTHTNAGVITIFLDGTQVLQITDTKEKSGKFGMYVGSNGGIIELSRFEFCYI
jgi:lysophospholipase L1-like esterase